MFLIPTWAIGIGFIIVVGTVGKIVARVFSAGDQLPGKKASRELEQTVARVRELVLAREAEELAEAVAALRDRADNSETFTSFEGPSLVAVGEGDLFFSPEEAERLAGQARHGRFRVFAGAKHLPNLEQPDEFNAALANFLADV